MCLEVSFRADGGFDPNGPSALGGVPETTSALLSFGLRDIAQWKTGLVLAGEIGSGTDVVKERTVGVI